MVLMRIDLRPPDTTVDHMARLRFGRRQLTTLSPLGKQLYYVEYVVCRYEYYGTVDDEGRGIIGSALPCGLRIHQSSSATVEFPVVSAVSILFISISDSTSKANVSSLPFTNFSHSPLLHLNSSALEVLNST